MNLTQPARPIALSLPWAGVLFSAVLTACGGGGGGGAVPSGPASVSGVQLDSATPMYSGTLLVTVTGSNLDQALALTSASCPNAVLSTTAPLISSATTAYFRCTVSALGAGQIDVTAGPFGATLASASFTVPTPEVTLTLNNGGNVNGDVVVSLDPTRAPITVDNFLDYVHAGFYAGTIMHRVVPGFVVQGGGYLPLNGATTPPVAKATNPPIQLEVGVGLSNLRGALAMARSAQADSATSQFFINLVDNVSLDTFNGGGYAVFGQIVAGAAVVDALAMVGCGPNIPGFSECAPSPDVVITAATQTR